MAEAPRPGAARRADAENTVMSLKIDGKTAFTLRPNDLSAKDAAALRRETGMSLAGVLRAGMEDPDLDIFAAMAWLARRQAGEDVSFEEVAAEFTYDRDYEQSDDPADAVEDGDSPEV